MRKKIFSNWDIICTLVPYIWGDYPGIKLRIILGFLLIIATMVLNLSVPLFLKGTIQALNEYQFQSIRIEQNGFILLLLAYGGAYTLGQITLKARQLIFYKVIEQATHRFSLKIFTHLHNLDLQFHLQRKLGVITSSVEKFQYVLPELFWTLALFLIPTIIEVFLAIAILFYLYHWIYAAILLGTFAIFLTFSFIGIRWTAIAQTEYENHMLNVQSCMVDSFLNYETVRHFNNRGHEAKIFDNTLEKVEKTSIRFRVRADFIQMLQGMIVGIGLCILTWLSGQEVINGTLDIGDFMAINCYLLQFIAPMVNFGYAIVQMNQAFTKLKYVMELLEERPEIIDLPNAPALNISSSSIVFEKVSFYYQADRLILQNISFNVPTGKTLAIVGSSGAGKSTIARLLFRFYDVADGKILINGQDIRSVTQSSLHSSIGVVSQDTTLFNMSLYNNILYGNPKASHEEIQNIIKLAHLDTFISRLPEGYNTLVGERGLKLSGGEKQRISIARALLKKPSIFLFDEATSSLDLPTEQEIKNNIIEVSRGATTIIIAHRLSTITHADEIIVLDNGAIMGRGKHSELLKNNSTYMKLWENQVLEAKTSLNLNFL